MQLATLTIQSGYIYFFVPAPFMKKGKTSDRKPVKADTDFSSCRCSHYRLIDVCCDVGTGLQPSL